VNQTRPYFKYISLIGYNLYIPCWLNIKSKFLSYIKAIGLVDFYKEEKDVSYSKKKKYISPRQRMKKCIYDVFIIWVLDVYVQGEAMYIIFCEIS
jgi:hypothetical protein